MPEEVKTLGNFVAIIDLHKDVKVELKFEVVAE
jgi:ribosomal protein L9